MLYIKLTILFTLFAINAMADKAPFWSTKETPFPQARQVSKTWTYRLAKAHGNVTFPDHYFWLENSYKTDKEAQKFAADQQALIKANDKAAWREISCITNDLKEGCSIVVVNDRSSKLDG